MSKKGRKKMPDFKTDEEFGQWLLDHDTADYVNWSNAEPVQFPNLKRSGHLVPVPVPDEEYDRLSKIALDEKKPVAELVRQVFQHGLKDFAAHRAR